MSDRKIRQSGAQYRKAAKQKAENATKLLKTIPKVTLFFKSAETTEKTTSESVDQV